MSQPCAICSPVLKSPSGVISRYRDFSTITNVSLYRGQFPTNAVMRSARFRVLLESSTSGCEKLTRHRLFLIRMEQHLHQQPMLHEFSLHSCPAAAPDLNSPPSRDQALSTAHVSYFLLRTRQEFAPFERGQPSTSKNRVDWLIGRQATIMCRSPGGQCAESFVLSDTDSNRAASQTPRCRSHRNPPCWDAARRAGRSSINDG